MSKSLVVSFLLFFSLSWVGAQSDQSQRSVSVLNAMWEAGYVTSKIQTPWAEFGKIELAFPKIDVINSDPFRKELQDHYALKKAALKSDKGISLEGLGQQNFNPQINEDNLIYRSRASAGVQWDLLSGGLLDNQAQARLLDEELMLKLGGIGNNGIQQISYGYRNNIIFYFNKKKLAILAKRKKLADTKIEVLTPLAKSNEIPATMLLDNYKQLIDIAGQYNLYGSFNESVAGLLDTSTLNIPHLLPPFDVNIQALKNLCGVAAPKTPINPNSPRSQSLLSKEIKFSTNLRYNYFDLITSTTNRNFISFGVNTSIPLRIFSKQYRAYHTHQHSAQWNQKKANDQILWMEISNLIYEFKYKLKQLGAWEEKQRIQKESLRIYQGLHQINDPSFHPIQALDALDMYYALELEKLDLLQQLYIKLGEIQVLLPTESINRYIIPYQKQSKPEEWIEEVNDEQFIYTRGTLHSAASKRGRAQIVIQDANTEKIVGDVSTSTPDGNFEVYFPKPGKYRYTVKIGNPAATLKGEFIIPDSATVPAFMDQNVTITKEKNGKLSLTIENGRLDSILKGVNAAEASLSFVRTGKKPLEIQTDPALLTNDDWTASSENTEISNGSSRPQNTAGQLDATYDSTQTNHVLTTQNRDTERVETVGADSATESIDSLTLSLVEKDLSDINEAENSNVDKNSNPAKTTESVAENKEIKTDIAPNSNTSETKKAENKIDITPSNTDQNQTKTASDTSEKETISLDQTEQKKEENPDDTKTNSNFSAQDSAANSIIQPEIAMDLNTLSNPTPNLKKEKSSGTYSLDIRAAHVIQLVLDGPRIDSSRTWDYYQKWMLHSLLLQYPEIAKEYKNRKLIDSLNTQLGSLVPLNRVIEKNTNPRIDEWYEQKSNLEWENRNVIKSLTTAHNKSLKSEVKKRMDDFNAMARPEEYPYLFKKVALLKNTSDSLFVLANAARTMANNEKDILQKNEHVQQAFDYEMNAHKTLQHLIMALDSKGVFALYNAEEINFLRSADDDKIRREFKNKKTYLATTDAAVGETFYIKSPKQEKNTPVEKDFYYTVQIGAFKNTFYIEQWEEWNTIIGEKIESGLTRVMIGKESSSEKAEASKLKLKSLGYSDAYIVLYSNGERIPVHEIIEVASQNDTTLLKQDELKNNKMSQWNRGMYIWSKAYLNQPIDPIISDLKNWKIDHVIISPTSQPSNWKQLQPLIQQLHSNEIGVEWMVGNNKWLNGPITGRLDSLLSQMSIWKIKTLHLDIEPHTFKDYKQNKEYYHELYISRIKEAHQFCNKNGFTLSVSIPLGLPTDVLQTLNTFTDQIVLMAYENPSVDAIQRRSQEEIAAAQNKCILALRAKDYKAAYQLEDDLLILKNWIPSHQTVIHDYNTYKLISSSNEKR